MASAISGVEGCDDPAPPRRVLGQVQIGGQEDLERNGGRRRSGRIDQHQIQRPAALGRVDKFHSDSTGNTDLDSAFFRSSETALSLRRPVTLPRCLRLHMPETLGSDGVPVPRSAPRHCHCRYKIFRPTPVTFWQKDRNIGTRARLHLPGVHKRSGDLRCIFREQWLWPCWPWAFLPG
jgi:hypothetical protein